MQVRVLPIADCQLPIANLVSTVSTGKVTVSIPAFATVGPVLTIHEITRNGTKHFVFVRVISWIGSPDSPFGNRQSDNLQYVTVAYL